MSRCRGTLALLALMAFAAVAHASSIYPDHIEDKKGKKITIIPHGILKSSTPKGKPEPFIKKAVFVKNNTIIHEPKVIVKLPKIKEEPIKDFTKKGPHGFFPKTEFIKNNTIIHKQKAIVKLPKIKEEPIKDFTKKGPHGFFPKTDFIKNNTIIHKPKVHDNMPKVKELPIVDISKPYKDLYKDVKKDAKDIYEDMKHQAYASQGSGYARKMF